MADVRETYVERTAECLRYRQALIAIRDHDGVSYRFGDEVRRIAREALDESLEG